MDILICEDNIEQLYEIKRIIQNLQKISNLKLNLRIASTRAEDLVQVIHTRGYQPGALFILDIGLDKSVINGFEIAQLIRKLDIWSAIVFVTTHSEMAYLTFTYKVAALDYILKDNLKNFQQKIIECVNLAYQRQKIACKEQTIAKKYLTFKVGSKLIRIFEDDFIYAETSPNKHRIIIHALNQQMEIYGSLDEVMTMSNKILRCHNSYVINSDQLQLLDLNSMLLFLNHNCSCPVSRKYLSSIKKILKSKRQG
ncbi:DNA-binding response regulator [Bombilactobacillus bombi]|uniref:DNA-binding response regulator n=1 Tax=Bombilactobacillus bombi TaxID=1303590 RepID=A0A3R6YIU2_9LACO|nr:LytTR family DNA-binding domain-containing protein [Bombilactobacillus bombi]RHW45992.1 DNA-binding response regulator [Bombilactobacillus bombi]